MITEGNPKDIPKPIHICTKVAKTTQPPKKLKNKNDIKLGRDTLRNVRNWRCLLGGENIIFNCMCKYNY